MRRREAEKAAKEEEEASGWSGAISGAITGAQTGGSVGGPYGAIVGAIVGAAGGYTLETETELGENTSLVMGAIGGVASGIGALGGLGGGATSGGGSTAPGMFGGVGGASAQAGRVLSASAASSRATIDTFIKAGMAIEGVLSPQGAAARSTVTKAFSAYANANKLNELIGDLPEDQRKLLQATSSNPALFKQAFGHVLQQQGKLNSKLVTEYGVTLSQVRESARQEGIPLATAIQNLQRRKLSIEEGAKLRVQRQAALDRAEIKQKLASGDWVFERPPWADQQDAKLQNEIARIQADPGLDWETKQREIEAIRRQQNDLRPTLQRRDKKKDKTFPETVAESSWYDQSTGIHWRKDRSGVPVPIDPDDIPKTPAQQWEEIRNKQYDELAKIAAAGDSKAPDYAEIKRQADAYANARFGLPTDTGAQGSTILGMLEARRRQGPGAMPAGPPKKAQPAPGVGIDRMGTMIDTFKAGVPGGVPPGGAGVVAPDTIPEHMPHNVVRLLPTAAAEHLRTVSKELDDASPMTWTEQQARKAAPAAIRRLKELGYVQREKLLTPADRKEIVWLQSILKRAGRGYSERSVDIVFGGELR